MNWHIFLNIQNALHKLHKILITYSFKLVYKITVVLYSLFDDANHLMSRPLAMNFFFTLSLHF